MRNYTKEFSDIILSRDRYSKRIIAVFTDTGLCILCTWLAFTLRLEELILFRDFNTKKVARLEINKSAVKSEALFLTFF